MLLEMQEGDRMHSLFPLHLYKKERVLILIIIIIIFFFGLVIFSLN